VSFDVFLQRFSGGEGAEVDRRAVREVLAKTTYRGPDDFGFYVVAFPDGVEVEFSASGLESQESFTGCVFHIRGIGDDLIKFMFDVARAGDMVMIPAMEDTPLVLVSDAQRSAVPSDMLDDLRPALVRSPEELGALLSGGFDGWSAYRDKVLGQSGPGGDTSDRS